MDKKSFLFGAGVGIILFAIVFYVAYRMEATNIDTGTQPMELTDADIIARAQELGMVDANMVPPAPNAEPAPELTAGEIVDKAIAMGMIFPEGTAVPTALPTQEPTPEPSVEPVATAEPTPTATPAQYVRVTIAAGSSATSIASLLAANGVIADANEFKNFLIAEGVTTTILPGTFNLPINGDYGEVMRIIRNINARVN